MNHAARAAWMGGVALLTASCAAIPRGAPEPVAVAPAAPPPPEAAASDDARPAHGFRLQGTVSQGGLVLGLAPANAGVLTLDGKPVPIAADGRFVIGFDRDAPAAAVLEARLADNQRVRQILTVAPRQWDIQSLPTLPKGMAQTAEQRRRREGEIAQIVAARAQNSATEGWRQSFAWPATGRISGVFGSQRIYAGEPGSPHGGVDVARPTGTPVASPADGIVVLAAAAPFSLEGNLLIIDHGMGLNSAFLHLSRIDVAVGDRVVQGQPVGAVGMTGRATGPHLHWAVTVRGTRIDPQLIVPPMPAA